MEDPGALLGAGDEMIGTLALIEAPDRGGLDRALSEDPYNREGLFETAIANGTEKKLPEPAPHLSRRWILNHWIDAGATSPENQ
jgi:hypothetical protein